MTQCLFSAAVIEPRLANYVQILRNYSISTFCFHTAYLGFRSFFLYHIQFSVKVMSALEFGGPVENYFHDYFH